MPEAVAQRVKAAGIVSATELVVGVEVGDVAHFLPQAGSAGFGHLAGQGDLNDAEIAAEGDLLVVGQRLVAEDQNGVAVHAGFYGGGLGGS